VQDGSKKAIIAAFLAHLGIASSEFVGFVEPDIRRSVTA
jgi:hypothetical protein